MIAEELILKIKSDIAKAEKDLKKYKGEVDKTQKSHKTFLGDMKSGIKTIAGWAAAIYGAYKSIKGIIDVSQYAAKTQQVGLAIENMTKQVGMSADTLVTNMQKMSKGTISQMDLMVNASKAALLGIPLNKMAELMEVARASAIAMGRDTSSMFEDLALGIGRQSRLILDNLGINISAAEAYRDYANSVGKSVKELTEAEQKQAYLNATLKDGARIIKMVGDVGKDMAPLEPMQQFKAALDDLKAALGDIFLPTINKVATAFATLFGNIRETIKETRELRKLAEAFAKEGTTGTIENDIKLMEARIKEIEAMNTYMRATREKRPDITPLGAALIAEHKALTEQIKKLKLEYVMLEAERRNQEQLDAAEARRKQHMIDLQAAIENGLSQYKIALMGTLTEEEKQIQTYNDIIEGLRTYRDNLLEAGDVNWEHYNSVAELITKYQELLTLLGTGAETKTIGSIMGGFKKGATITWGEDFEDAKEAAEEMKEPLKSMMNHELPGIRDKAYEIAEQMGLSAAMIELNNREAEQWYANLGKVEEEAENIKSSFILFSGVIQQLKDNLEDALINVGLQAAYDLSGALVTAFQDGATAAEKLKQALKNAMSAALKALGTFFLTSGNIPGAIAAYAGAGAVAALQQGGIVTKPTLAMIGEKGPEAVVPLNKGNVAPVTIIVQGSVISEKQLEGIALNAVGRASRGY